MEIQAFMYTLNFVVENVGPLEFPVWLSLIWTIRISGGHPSKPFRQFSRLIYCKSQSHRYIFKMNRVFLHGRSFRPALLRSKLSLGNKGESL